MLGAWLTRGLVMAVVHAAAMTLLAKWSVFHPTDQTVITSLTLAVLVGVAALWSAVDGWRDRPDRGRAWFIAALVTGLAGGVLYVIGRAVFVDQTGVAELKSALTGGAAFSALLVLIPAGLGLFVGGRIRRPARADTGDGDGDAEPDEDRHRRSTGELDLPGAGPAGSGAATGSAAASVGSGSTAGPGSASGSGSGSGSAASPADRRAKRRKPSPNRRPRPAPDGSDTPSDSPTAGSPRPGVGRRTGDLGAETADPAAAHQSGDDAHQPGDQAPPVSRPVAGRSRRRPTVAGRPPSPRSR